MVLLCNGNEISWVRSYLGTNQFGYEPVWLRTCLVTKSPDFISSTYTCSIELYMYFYLSIETIGSYECRINKFL